MVQTFLVRSQAKSGDKWREVSMEKGIFRSAAMYSVIGLTMLIRAVHKLHA